MITIAGTSFIPTDGKDTFLLTPTLGWYLQIASFSKRLGTSLGVLPYKHTKKENKSPSQLSTQQKLEAENLPRRQDLLHSTPQQLYKVDLIDRSL